MTKHLHEDALKIPLTLEETKVEITPKILDNTMIITSTHSLPKPRENLKVCLAVPKATERKTSSLAKATRHLYDLESSNTPEKALNIDLGLYQMEDC